MTKLSLAPLKQFEATAKFAAYLANVRSELHGDVNSGISGPDPLTDNTRLRLVGDDRKQELKEETIDDPDVNLGGTDDQINTIIEEGAARAAA